MSQYHDPDFGNSPNGSFAFPGSTPELPFGDILDQPMIEAAFAEENVAFGHDPRTIFSPMVTLGTFVLQVLSADKSCVNAVIRVSLLMLALGRKPCSDDTSAYCRARAKLPAALIRRLTRASARELEARIPSHWKPHGRTFKLIDGTTLLLPDTEENQKAYPQPKSQTAGLGFPIIRLVLVLSLATGMIHDVAFGPYTGKGTGELALLRQLLDGFAAGEVMLADSYYCCFFLVALALARGLEVVFRQHGSRHTDFSQGQRLGKGDHVVVWKRPARPEWMDEETYAQIPATLTLREVAVKVPDPGFRTRSLVVVTSFTDPKEFSAADLGEVYRNRWLVELDIRNIKTTMQMDRLRCKTPFMVEKELWAHLLGYNFVRKIIAQSAMLNHRLPRQYSFKKALRAVGQHWQLLASADAAERSRLDWHLMRIIAGRKVGNRPGRIEPRAKKYRGNRLPFLTKPRAEARAALLDG